MITIEDGLKLRGTNYLRLLFFRIHHLLFYFIQITVLIIIVHRIISLSVATFCNSLALIESEIIIQQLLGVPVRNLVFVILKIKTRLVFFGLLF